MTLTFEGILARARMTAGDRARHGSMPANFGLPGRERLPPGTGTSIVRPSALARLRNFLKGT